MRDLKDYLFDVFLVSVIGAYVDKNDPNVVTLVIPNPSEIETKEKDGKIEISGKFKGYLNGIMRADGNFGIEKKDDEISIRYVQWHKPLDDRKFVRSYGELNVKGEILDMKTENDKMVAKIRVEKVESIESPLTSYDDIEYDWNYDDHIFINPFVNPKIDQL